MNDIKKNIRSITNTPLMRIVLYAPIVFIVVMIALIFWSYKFLPPQIPIYYSRPWGQEQLAAPLFLFVLPGGTLLWYVGCLWFIGKQTYHYRVFSQILLMVQCISCILAVLVIINIVRIII